LNQGDRILIDAATMSESNIEAAKAENLRRDQAQRIMNLFLSHQERSRTQQSLQQQTQVTFVTANIPSGTAQSVPSDNYQGPPCPRFEEIKQWMLDNEEALAIFTWQFLMGENVMLAHILRIGTLALHPNEWRAFLIQCNITKQLFK